MNNALLINTVQQTNFVSPLRYISGRIVEYDMKQANVSILYQKGAISYEFYNFLCNSPKMYREREIGMMERRDQTIYDIISNGIKEYKLKFVELNKINLNQIVRIANDAIYVNTPIDFQNTIVDNYIEFRPKSISNVMVQLQKDLLIFIEFGIDKINIDVKGIGDKYLLHSNYFLNIIGTTIFLSERSGVDDALRYLSDIIAQYINKKLDINYYKEFNSESMYRINVMNHVYLSIDADNSCKSALDINYNLGLLRELWSIILERYR